MVYGRGLLPLFFLHFLRTVSLKPSYIEVNKQRTPESHGLRAIRYSLSIGFITGKSLGLLKSRPVSRSREMGL